MRRPNSVCRHGWINELGLPAAGRVAGDRCRMTRFFATESLCKSFGGLRAVDRVSIAAEPGEVLGIAGPNGSGKSTFFNIVTAVPYPADAGRVMFEGREIQRLPGHVIARAGLARTFQRETVFAGLSAVDNVLTAVEHGKGSGRFADHVDAAQRTLDLVGFPATMHNVPAGALPVFHRKLLMIAGALALGPRLLLLDEPASSLTETEIERMQALIEQLRESGLAILLIEHVLPLLSAVSDRLVVFDQGRVIAEGRPAEVVRQPQVVEAYLGGAAR